MTDCCFNCDTVYPQTHFTQLIHYLTESDIYCNHLLTSCKISENTKTHADKCRVMLSPVKHKYFICLNSLSLWMQMIDPCLFPQELRLFSAYFLSWLETTNKAVTCYKTWVFSISRQMSVLHTLSLGKHIFPMSDQMSTCSWKTDAHYTSQNIHPINHL